MECLISLIHSEGSNVPLRTCWGDEPGAVTYSQELPIAALVHHLSPTALGPPSSVFLLPDSYLLKPCLESHISVTSHEWCCIMLPFEFGFFIQHGIRVHACCRRY